MKSTGSQSREAFKWTGLSRLIEVGTISRGPLSLSPPLGSETAGGKGGPLGSKTAATSQLLSSVPAQTAGAGCEDGTVKKNKALTPDLGVKKQQNT